MTTTVAFLATRKGSPTIDQQLVKVGQVDHVVLASEHSFTGLDEALNAIGVTLGAGDRLRLFDLFSIALSTPTLVRLLTGFLSRGIVIDIAALDLELTSAAGDPAFRLLGALDEHHRRLHGQKTHPASGTPPGRKPLLQPDDLDDINERLTAPGATAASVARDLGVGRSTLFNYLERYDRERRAKSRGKRSALESQEPASPPARSTKEDD